MNVNLNRPNSGRPGASFSNVNPRIYQQGEKKENPKAMAGIFDKLISLSLFMTFFGLPIFFTGLTFQGVVFEKQIYFYFWVLLASVAWASKSVISGEMKIKRTPLDIAIAIFWLAGLVSTLFSVDKWHSFWGFFGDPSRGLLNITAVIVMYYVILSNFNAKRLRLMMTGFVSAVGVVSLWTLLTIFGVTFLPAKLREFSPVSLTGTISGLRLFLGASIPVILSVVFKMNEDGASKRSKKVLTPLMLIVVAFNILILIALYDKISMLIILLGLGFTLVYVLAKIVRPKENITWVPMLVFVFGIIALMVGPNDLARINIPLEVSPNSKISWEIAKGGLKEDAIFGSGLATYGYDFSAYKPQEFNNNMFYNLRFYQGSGLFFESISTTGILGTVALIFLTLTFFGVAMYLLTKNKERNKIYSLGLISCSIILIVSSFLFRLEGTILILTGLIASLAMAALFFEGETEGDYLNLSLKASPKFALALAFVFIVVSSVVAVLVVFIGKVYLADIYAGKGSRETEISEEGSIRMITKAYSLNKREARYSLRASQEYMALANYEILNSGEAVDEAKVKKIQAYANKSIEFGKDGAAKMPNDVLAISVLAQVYESAGAYAPEMLPLSEEQYRKALELEKHNPVFYLKIGQFKLSLASQEENEDEKQRLLEEAEENLKMSIEKKMDFAPGYYNLAIAFEALGKTDDAIIANVKAISGDSKNVGYLFNLGRIYQTRGKGEDESNAKKVYNYILAVDPNHVNANFNLGVLFEKTGEKDAAIERYQKVLDLVSEGKDENVKEQVQKMINNVKSGVSNLKSVPAEEPIVEEEVKTEEEKTNLIGPEQVQGDRTTTEETPAPAEETQN
ncbi:MAG: hypothetical protein OEV93_05055 [Candidatus Moranbacteria bacterium]|nr:hypothetical protein [Candidatus Moranbacteria bacterium]